MIPAHNEESTVDGVFAGHRGIARALASSFEIIVFDDGNTDATWAALEASRAATSEPRLMRNPSRGAIPFSMKRLYADARGEWIYFAPADGQVPAVALERMSSVRDGAALVVGRRIPQPLAAVDAIRAHARHEGGVLGQSGDQCLLQRRLF